MKAIMIKYVRQLVLPFCMVVATLFSADPEVISGGATFFNTTHWQADYSWKQGWYEGSEVYYNPSGSDNWEFEHESSLAAANAAWGSNSLALSTLNSRFGYQWCTQNFYDVAQFDTTW
jgi:hypothetical protein